MYPPSAKLRPLTVLQLEEKAYLPGEEGSVYHIADVVLGP